jgi:acid phosphatase
MLAALGIFEDDQDLPVDKIMSDRKWKTSQITPMGGRIIFERLSCVSKSNSSEKEIFVRFNVNDGIVPLDRCSGGPGGSCLLSSFLGHVKRRREIAGDFRGTCGLAKDAPDRPTFLRQPGTAPPAVDMGIKAAEKGKAKYRFWGI